MSRIMDSPLHDLNFILQNVGYMEHFMKYYRYHGLFLDDLEEGLCPKEWFTFGNIWQ